MKTMLPFLCMILLAGCSSVEMKEPFPVSQLSEKEREQLEGAWKVDEAVFYVAFASNGVAQLAGIDWDKEDEVFRLESFPLHFAKCNGALYVSMPQESDEPDRFIFAELKTDSSTIVAWMPNLDLFEKLVDQGKLKGTVEKEKHSKEILLDMPAADILELISTNPATINYKDPLVFQRLK